MGHWPVQTEETEMTDRQMFGLSGAVLFATFAVLCMVYGSGPSRTLVVIALWLGASSQFFAQGDRASVRYAAYCLSICAWILASFAAGIFSAQIMAV